MTALAQSRDAQEIAVLPLREDAERRGDVFVYESPDLPGQWVARDAVTGVVSQGNSRPHALAMLAEALALHAGEALPTGEPADGARTVDAVAREVVAWAGTPAGLLAMMAHRGKQDLVALATAVLERGARLAGPGATREPPALGPEAIPALGCDWQKIEGILSRATPLAAEEGDAADLCPELEALVLAGGIPCPPAPGWIWRVEGGSARCLPWTDPSEEGVGLRQRFERVLAARGPAWFPVLVQTPQRTVLTAMEQSLFRPAAGVSPDQSIHELAGHLVRAGHDSAARGRVVVAEAVPYEDVPGAYKVRVTSAAPDDLSAEQRQSLEAMPVPATARPASATGVLITLQPPGQAALVCALSVSRPTDTGVSPAITARFLAGGFPCPAPPGHLWVSQGGAKPVCVPWSEVPLIAACLRAQAEELLAVRGPGWFPVYLERDGSGEFAVLDGALFLSAAADPGAAAEELAGILALAGHAEAVPPGQVIVCDAALVPDGLPGVLPGARTVRVCCDPPEAISPRGQEALAGVAHFLAKGLAPALLQIQVDAANAVVGAVVIGTTTAVAKPDSTTDPEEG